MNQIRISILILLLILAGLSPTSAIDSTIINFKVKIKCNTPEGEDVCVYIENLVGPGKECVFPMEKTSENKWKLSVDLSEIDLTSPVKYKYCRNQDWGSADEAFDNSNLQGMREVSVFGPRTNVKDVVKKWRWLPKKGIIPEINIRSHLTDPPSHLPLQSFICGVELTDYWDDIFRPYIGPTLDKIKKKTNAKWIQYNPITEIKRFYPKPIIEREGAAGTPEEDLIKIITDSHKQGFKVYLYPYTWAFDVTDPSPNYHKNPWWKAYFDQWNPILLYYAQIAQDYNVEMLGFPIAPNIWVISSEEVPIIDNLSRELMKKVRKIYKGKICVQFHYGGVLQWNRDMNVFGDGDYLDFGVWDYFPWRLGDSKNPSVSEMVKILRNGLDGIIPMLNNLKWGKPFILGSIASSSYDGAAMGLASEDDVAAWNPDNPEFPVDLKEQADVYEAILRVITEKKWIAGAFSFTLKYWDAIDKDVNIRGKPTVNVLAKWFGWIQGKFARIEVNKDVLTFKAEIGEEDLISKTFKLRNSGEDTLRYQIKSSQKWIKVKPKRGKSTGEYDEIEVMVDSKRLKKGKHEGEIEIKSSAAYNSPQEIKVNLIISTP